MISKSPEVTLLLDLRLGFKLTAVARSSPLVSQLARWKRPETTDQGLCLRHLAEHSAYC